ncbi:MAG: galactitol-1-phosphate 5-dehydrogenase [Eubacteriales bacterium]|nr:galactitol-1-phosphate 5-dehydrogenase [Eubacteriales bacterium]
MKALVYTSPGVLELQERPIPQPGAGEVRIQVRANGICGSDVQGYLGKTGRRVPPLVMGHEFSGQVDAVGDRVSRFKPKDRVIAYPALYCGRCPDCLAGQQHRCRHKTFLGAMSQDGAMAEYLCLPEHLLLPLPDAVSYETGALTEPLAVAWRAVCQAGDLTGKTVLIVGAGTIGLLALQAVRLKNPSLILVSEISPARAERARLFGADGVVDPTRTPLSDWLAGQGARDGIDVSIEAVGLSVTAAQALDALKPGGTSIWIGNHQRQITCDMQSIVTRELTIRGTYIYSPEQFAQALDLLANCKIQSDGLISDRLRLADGPEAFRFLASDPEKHLKVMLLNP